MYALFNLCSNQLLDFNINKEKVNQFQFKIIIQ